MRVLAVMLGGLLATNLAHAATAFTGQDYSGIYACTGVDAHEGNYTGTVTLQLNVAQSTGDHGAYQFKLDVPGFGAYLGHAISEGDKLAIYFALPDQATKDYGSGIATMRQDPSGRLAFRKFYYEPEYKGGNTGSEDCVMKP